MTSATLFFIFSIYCASHLVFCGVNICLPQSSVFFERLVAGDIAMSFTPLKSAVRVNCVSAHHEEQPQP